MRWRRDSLSTYIRRPPFIDIGGSALPGVIDNARALVVAGDPLTTDFTTPSGEILPETQAGQFLIASGVAPKDFNAVTQRGGNHQSMARVTFANQRMKNRLAGGIEGGLTRLRSDGKLLTIFDAAERLRAAGLPLVFEPEESVDGLGLTGFETFRITDLDAALAEGKPVAIRAVVQDGKVATFLVRPDAASAHERRLLRHGGILAAILKSRLAGGQGQGRPPLTTRRVSGNNAGSPHFVGRALRDLPRPDRQLPRARFYQVCPTTPVKFACCSSPKDRHRPRR